MYVSVCGDVHECAGIHRCLGHQISCAGVTWGSEPPNVGGGSQIVCMRVHAHVCCVVSDEDILNLRLYNSVNIPKYVGLGHVSSVVYELHAERQNTE